MKSAFRRSALWLVLMALGGGLALPVSAQVKLRETRPVVDLPGGPLRDIIFEQCVRCHGIDDYAFNALDREGWAELIDTIHIPRGVVLEGNDREIFLDYLVANFGPDSIPFPRGYIPTEATEFFSDGDARVFLDSTCTSCHNLDRVFESRYAAERWRVVVLDMRERGAELNDENLEKLVEWLGRVRGTNRNQ